MKIYFVNEDKTKLVVMDSESKTFEAFEQAERVGSFALEIVPKVDEVVVDDRPAKAGKVGRRCGQCGKKGHRKDKCGEQVTGKKTGVAVKGKAMRYCARCHELKSGIKPNGVCGDCLKTPIGEEFAYGRSFEACDSIVQKADSLRGDDLKALADQEGLTMTQMYNLRSKVRDRWNQEADAKRSPAKPVDVLPDDATAAREEAAINEEVV